MTWFKVDDSFWSHPKRLLCPPSAIGLWVTAGSWSGQHLTDGAIPEPMLSLFGTRGRDVLRLVDAGLWEPIEGGWWFHDWDDWQPTRGQVLERRAAETARKKEARERYREQKQGQSRKVSHRDNPPDARQESLTESRRVSSRDSRQVSRDVSALPDPTRPVVRKKEQEQTLLSPAATAEIVTGGQIAVAFDEWWQVYPRKVAKDAARRRYEQIIKKGVSPQELLVGVKAYAREMRGTEPRFVKSPDGWLNAGRWQDEPSKPALPSAQAGMPW